MSVAPYLFLCVIEVNVVISSVLLCPCIMCTVRACDEVHWKVRHPGLDTWHEGSLFRERILLLGSIAWYSGTDMRHEGFLFHERV
jgi:hypothetical protein